MHSSSILDSSKRSAPIVEAILAGNQRLRFDERRLKPAHKKQMNSLFSGPGSAFARTCSKNTQQLQQQAKRSGALASHPTDAYCLRHCYRLIVGKAMRKHR